MGLFNFFKKENKEAQKPAEVKNELFLSVSKYNDYIVRFVDMLIQGDYAPISAYEKPNGEVAGFLYTGGDDNLYMLFADEVVNRMESNFEQKLANGQINSYVILYHSQFANDDNHTVASTAEEFKAITLAYNFKNNSKGKIALPYFFEEDQVKFQGFTNFSREENELIFSTQLKEGVDYFQDREAITPPIIENETGLRIKKSNTLDLNNTWGGVFGFESYRKPGGGQVLNEYFALAIAKGREYKTSNISVSEVAVGDVTFKTISVNGKPKALLPVIKTGFAINVENKEINEWENMGDLVAIITGNGRNTFGLDYLATDYAENKEIYLSTKELTVSISGIAFVLDISTINEQAGELTYSEDFTMYMPNNSLPNYACFDFIGQLEDFKETVLPGGDNLKGYLMKVRLITQPDFKDFFTIDMYVAQENMRFEQLTIGMKITGAFQMQGQIAQ